MLQLLLPSNPGSDAQRVQGAADVLFIYFLTNEFNSGFRASAQTFLNVLPPS